MIPKSEVGVLSKDSKNVVQLIESAYNVSCQFTTVKFGTFFFFYVHYIFKLLNHFVTSKCFLFMWFLYNILQRLSSKVTLTHDNLPDTVKVVYTPKCDHGGPPGDREGVCDNVRAGQKVSSFS